PSSPGTTVRRPAAVTGSAVAASPAIASAPGGPVAGLGAAVTGDACGAGQFEVESFTPDALVEVEQRGDAGADREGERGGDDGADAHGDQVGPAHFRDGLGESGDALTAGDGADERGRHLNDRGDDEHQDHGQ